MQATIAFAQRLDTRLRIFFEHRGAAFAVLAIIVLAAHGYEIFNFHLTIDEEVHAGARNIANAWISEGRWGMALLSELLPSSVVPAISTALGVGLLATALWFLLVHAFTVDRYAAVIAVATAVTIPVLPFTLSFTTLAYGIGFAALAALGFIVSLRGKSPADLLLGGFAGAFSISVYQPMLFALAALVVFQMCDPRGDLPARDRWQSPAALLGAIALYFVIDQIVRRVSGVELRYVDQYVDVGGLISHPLERISTATRDTLLVLQGQRNLFALRSPWLAVFIVAAIWLCASRITSAQGHARFAPILAAMLLLGLPVAAASLAKYGVPLRSSVHYSYVVSLLAALAYMNGGPKGRLMLTLFAALAILGNATVSNRLYAAAAFAYERDRSIASDIMRETAKLTVSDSEPRELHLEIVGSLSWPESPVAPKRETLGASIFEWEGGNRFRVAAFLRLFGLVIQGASEPETLQVAPIALNMPRWPNDGWVRRDANVIVVKLGDYTPIQRQALCNAGGQGFCR